MTDKPHTMLTILAMPEGGYTIANGTPGYQLEIFAATTIDEALRFIRGKMLPPQERIVPKYEP